MFLHILFSQERIGKGGKTFQIYKFRTMYEGAEHDQYKYSPLNQANGPVFKIYNDPRFTKIGRWLANTGLDELPQFINIAKGEMALIGPRPLPTHEESKIPTKWRIRRQSVKPGLTSSWVINGSHNMTFKEWMELDMLDIKKNNNWKHKTIILMKTMFMLIKNVFKENPQLS